MVDIGSGPVDPLPVFRLKLGNPKFVCPNVNSDEVDPNPIPLGGTLAAHVPVFVVEVPEAAGTPILVVCGDATVGGFATVLALLLELIEKPSAGVGTKPRTDPI